MEYARKEAAAYGVEADDAEDWQINGIDPAKYYSTEEYEDKSCYCVTYIFESGEDAEDLADRIIFSLAK